MDPLINFRKTLSQLKAYVSLPITNDRDRAGIIQAFEFTFEQAWKAIQKKATLLGLEVGSPKKSFSVAMENFWIPIEEESKWLQLIKDRNLTSHTYHEDIAKEVLDRITANYIPMFESLLNQLTSEDPPTTHTPSK